MSCCFGRCLQVLPAPETVSSSRRLPSPRSSVQVSLAARSFCRPPEPWSAPRSGVPTVPLQATLPLARTWRRSRSTELFSFNAGYHQSDFTFIAVCRG
eukprot:8926464-Pyramimonas_sp.AAC.1